MLRLYFISFAYVLSLLHPFFFFFAFLLSSFLSFCSCVCLSFCPLCSCFYLFSCFPCLSSCLPCLFLCHCGVCVFFFPFGLYAKRKGAPCWCVLSCPVVVRWLLSHHYNFSGFYSVLHACHIVNRCKVPIPSVSVVIEANKRKI